MTTTPKMTPSELTTHLVAAVYAVEALTATMHTQEDWQRFYDREGGPLPFVKRVFPNWADGAHSLFVQVFLGHLKEARVQIYATMQNQG